MAEIARALMSFWEHMEHSCGNQMSGHKGGFRSVDVRQMLRMGRRSHGPEPRNGGLLIGPEALRRVLGKTRSLHRVKVPGVSTLAGAQTCC